MCRNRTVACIGINNRVDVSSYLSQDLFSVQHQYPAPISICYCFSMFCCNIALSCVRQYFLLIPTVCFIALSQGLVDMNKPPEMISSWQYDRRWMEIKKYPFIQGQYFLNFGIIYLMYTNEIVPFAAAVCIFRSFYEVCMYCGTTTELLAYDRVQFFSSFRLGALVDVNTYPEMVTQSQHPTSLVDNLFSPTSGISGLPTCAP
jgi:hypothetical protein